MSSWSLVISCSWNFDLIADISLVASVNILHVIISPSGRSLIKIANKFGPKTDHFWTSLATCIQPYKVSPNTSHCLRSVRKAVCFAGSVAACWICGRICGRICGVRKAIGCAVLLLVTNLWTNFSAWLNAYLNQMFRVFAISLLS